MYRIEISFDTELSNIITQFNSWRKNREKRGRTSGWI